MNGTPPEGEGVMGYALVREQRDAYERILWELKVGTDPYTLSTVWNYVQAIQTLRRINKKVTKVLDRSWG